MFTKLLISLLTLSTFTAHTLASDTHYVNTKTLKVRLAPTSKSAHLYSLYKGHKVKVYEIKNSWARISEYTKTAQWVHEDYLTQLDSAKTKKKIEKVQVIEKPIPVIEKKPKEKTIVKEPEPQTIIEEDIPEDISMEAMLLETISKSDDYERYKSTFTSVSQRLFKNETCRLKDFKRSNGWMEISDGELYFIYCGKIKKQNKIFLNVSTGETFKKTY